jgi:hypothetical protein
VRAATAAFARRQRGSSSKDDGDDDDHDDENVETGERPARQPTAQPTEPTVTEGKPFDEAPAIDTKPMPRPGPKEAWRDDTRPMGRPDPKDLPAIEPPDPRAEPWPDATPPPMRPVPAAPGRQHQETVGYSLVGAGSSDFGRPPDMPKTAAPAPLVLGDVENPAHMPGPRDVPSGNPDDPAPAPGHVPPGDSRSLRRGNEFALVYRVGTCVITRTGILGTRGQWRVVEYPTSAAASGSYAKECSRFVSDGFSDYRD